MPRIHATPASAIVALAATGVCGCSDDDAARKTPAPAARAAEFRPAPPSDWVSAPAVKSPGADAPLPPAAPPPASGLDYAPHGDVDTSGFVAATAKVGRWRPDAPPEVVREAWLGLGARLRAEAEPFLDPRYAADASTVAAYLETAAMWNYDAEPWKAYEVLERARRAVTADPTLAAKHLYSIIWFQGVTALRAGETDNCVACRGASSCILPIAPAAVHTNRRGSALAVRHFGEYLDRFPDDDGTKWLLNLAHMTLGEYPQGVATGRLVPIDAYLNGAGGIGPFREIGHDVGLDRFNQAGGAILDDFDGDGLFDVVVSTNDPTGPMGLFRNRGDGTFEDRSVASGLSKVYGGIYSVQGDYDGDGDLDVYVARGAWLSRPMRPSLLANDGTGAFTDVTDAAGLGAPGNSISGAFADYDGDGRLDLYVVCERQPSRLWHNEGDGTFRDMAWKAGVGCDGAVAKGATWIDADDDGRPDLFVTDLTGGARFFRNRGDGTFADATAAAGVDGPLAGFGCFSFDFDDDGRLDVFATSYDRSVGDIVAGLGGRPHRRHPPRLWRNVDGRRFEDVTDAAGVNRSFAAMGLQFADFDGDGRLDVYLGTGDPQISMLVPNRMFRNVDGRTFAEVTAASGTGHLQKGHSVACGDWDRDGDIDLFEELGGATHGDRYHNVLFDNPGNGNAWVSLELRGVRANRRGVGARIRIETDAVPPRTLHRVVTSGASFGASPLEATIGLGRAERIARIEVRWPGSGTVQTFRDVAVGRRYRVTEDAPALADVTLPPVPHPK